MSAPTIMTPLWVLCLGLWSAGCGACPKTDAETAREPASAPAAADPVPDHSAGEPSGGPEPGDELGAVNGDMVGLWRRFWSPDGEAETERYLFLADGRWGWRAVPEDSAGGPPCVLRRSGRWGWRNGMLVIAEDEREERARCVHGSAQCGPSGQQGGAPAGAPAGGCAHRARHSGHGGHGEGGCPCRKRQYRVVRPSSPKVEHLPVGDCPPNREAEHLDTTYACRSIGGQVFWRQSSGENVDEALFVGVPATGDGAE